MKLFIDLHTHTIASGHAYGTWTENAKAAGLQGLKVVGISEHAPMMPGSCQEVYFTNFKVLPKYVDGVRVLNGIEANIYDYAGSIDVGRAVEHKVDYVIASLHTPCIESGTVAQNTAALIGAMRNPYVKIIGHPDDDRYPVDYEELVQAAKAEKVALELNNSSIHPMSVRVNAEKNIRHMLEKCMDYGTMILMGTDSHYCGEVGKFEASCRILEEVQFPEELIINVDMERLPYVLNREI